MDRIKLFIFLQFFCCLIYSQRYSSPNPILHPTAFIPDGEPHIFYYNGEERVFLYGSRDERITGYCGYGHDVWSAPVDDLGKWTNHGEIFNVKQVHEIGYGITNEQHFGAPDCVYNPLNKKYYLYTFLGAPYKTSQITAKDNIVPGFQDLGPKCVVAESESPAGPFINPRMCDWPALNSAGTFDPAVLVDEQADGSIRVYAYWGMREGDRCAELDPNDMCTIINSETRKPDRNAYKKTLMPKEQNNGSSLFEASSIRKISDNKYVFIYSPNERPSALTYCFSNSPLGPWEYGGVIVDNKDGWKGGNNHGSIARIRKSWYVFYHRHCGNGINRQAMMQPISLSITKDSVIIPKVPLLSEATPGKGLYPFKRYNISSCCYRKKNCYVSGAPRLSDGLQPLVNIRNGEEIGVKYFNFGLSGVKKFSLSLNIRLLNDDCNLDVLSLNKGSNDSILLGSYDLGDFFDSEKSYQELVLDLKSKSRLRGEQAIFFRFQSKADTPLCEIKEFEFRKKKTDPTPNALHEIGIIKSSETFGIRTLPTKARQGESVKVLLGSEHDAEILLNIMDSNGKKIEAKRNALVPYGPISYNFEMPDDKVFINVE